MKILLACEFYFPSRGGVQEVIRQVAEHLVRHRHDVTVVTSAMHERDFDELNGVKIQSFDISGNLVSGLRGDVDAYRQFVATCGADVLMIKAVQQWSFDALLGHLAELPMRKLVIPCGFAGISKPEYAAYYRALPAQLRSFEKIITYGAECRDTDILRQWNLPAPDIVANGASETEFSSANRDDARRLLGMATDEFVFITVGTLTGIKGHQEVARAFLQMKNGGQRRVTLILNGNRPKIAIGGKQGRGLRGIAACAKQILLAASLQLYRWRATLQPGKRILIRDFPRRDLLNALCAANLFVFASRTEYSPLVLFEAAAAGTPFLSIPVGNAAEIARWTGAGKICPAVRDAHGFVHADVAQMSRHMAESMSARDALAASGRKGRENWQQHFTWDVISARYEELIGS